MKFCIGAIITSLTGSVFIAKELLKFDIFLSMIGLVLHQVPIICASSYCTERPIQPSSSYVEHRYQFRVTVKTSNTT